MRCRLWVKTFEQVEELEGWREDEPERGRSWEGRDWKRDGPDTSCSPSGQRAIDFRFLCVAANGYSRSGVRTRSAFGIMSISTIVAGPVNPSLATEVGRERKHVCGTEVFSGYVV
jgi:hypothetical protein